MLQIKLTLIDGATKTSSPLIGEEFAHRLANECRKDPSVAKAEVLPVTEPAEVSAAA